MPLQNVKLPSPRLGKLILQFQPCRNIHTHKLLNKQLGRIRNRHLHHRPTRLTPLTPIQIPHEPARLADIDLVPIRGHHEPLEEELAGSVGDEAVAFHFAEAEAAVARAAFGGLAGEHCAGAAGAGMHFVLDHVFEFLVVDRSREDVEGEGVAGYAGGEVFFAAVGEAVIDEGAGGFFDGGAAEAGAVAVVAGEHACFAGYKLEHFTDCHARGEAVRVHDDVRVDPLVCEGHVALVGHDAYDALLAVARGELVADFGAARLPREHFNELAFAFGGGDHDLVDEGWVGQFVGHRSRLVADGPAEVGARDAGGVCLVRV